MSLLTNNIVPGNHGRVFGTNAKEDSDLKAIEKSILEIDGIKEVVINAHVFPREITIYTNRIIDIHTIETKVKSVGFHIMPKENLDV
jgi:copper chaperone CopZ